MNRYVVGFLVSIGLLVLIIVLLFSSNGSKSAPKLNSPTLQSYSNTDAVAKLTIDGPITAGQTHNTIQITVGQNSTTYNLIEGYNNDVIASKTYPNTKTGYSAFLSSLYYAGYTKGNNSSSLASEAGYCPIGDRYIFELSQNGKDIERYWATNCGGSPKSYDGDLLLTLQLFKAQVPDYIDLSQNSNT